jgi:ABC-type multidrug transport system ATPase subunit
MIESWQLALLEIDNLRTPLFGPVSFSVGKGECVSIQGPSGAGKSLLLRAIVDLDPNEGDVRLGDVRRNLIPANEWRRSVAMVPVESGWWSDRVADHFEPGCDPLPMLEAVGLPGALEWDVSRLSSGERQRLAIVRALCARPSAILLDEPTASLDDEATSRVEELLLEQCANGVAIIIVTHDKRQPARLSARPFIMKSGQLSPVQEASA